MKLTKKKWLIIWVVLISLVLLVVSCSEPENQISRMRASRSFAGPTHYPPADSAAYGIVAFRSSSSDIDKKRIMMFCRAYTAALPHVSELTQVPLSQQMIHVWPVESDSLALKLNGISMSKVCKVAVDGYGLAASKDVMSDFNTGSIARKKGPFLFSFFPDSTEDKKDIVSLNYNLSFVDTKEEAFNLFVVWVQGIESDPSVSYGIE